MEFTEQPPRLFKLTRKAYGDYEMAVVTIPDVTRWQRKTLKLANLE